MNGLGPRLACVAGLVRTGSRLADIGTDHAALPVALIGAGICPRAIASDVREGPLAAAHRAVAAAGLGGRIALRLGDGLAVLAPGEADEIVIAGMGGETIAAILQGAPWLRESPATRLLLQPMSRPEALRAWLLANGFVLRTEPVVREGDHLYSVLCVEHTGAPPVPDALLPYVGAIDTAAGPEAAAYLNKVRRRLLRRAQGLAAGRDAAGAAAEIHQLRALARRIGERVKNGGEA